MFQTFQKVTQVCWVTFLKIPKHGTLLIPSYGILTYAKIDNMQISLIKDALSQCGSNFPESYPGMLGNFPENFKAWDTDDPKLWNIDICQNRQYANFAN